MKNKTNIRSMAIEAIDLISSNRAFSNEIINEKLPLIKDYRDESLFRELVYGTTENLIYIDYIIGKASKIKVKKMEKLILNAIRVGVYELVFLRIEDYATVNEIVNIVKRKKGIKASNFTNAVLRNINRNLESFKEVNISDEKLYLSVKYSFHPDIITYLSEYYSYDELEKILVFLSKRPSLTIRCNEHLVTKKQLYDLMTEKGYSLEDSKIAKSGFIINNPVKITATKEFQEGFFTIQDQASIRVSEELNPDENVKILDLCAAPGSKSSHLSQISNDKSLVVANDIAKNKLFKIEENFNRLKFKNYKITNFDASEVIDDFKEEFDYILVDAPCSGLGVIRRKPEIKLYRTIDEIKSLAQLQKQILSNAVNYLKQGGKLVYSTCTLGPLENENIVNLILKEHPDIKLDDSNGPSMIELLPHKDETDGFFISKLTKN